MNMGTSSTMVMTMASATGTATAATASSTMTMSMGGASSCKISMLWNWYTVDSCFIARSWHITSRGMFAGSCIGVVLLVMSLEFLRRASKEYDQYIVHQVQKNSQQVVSLSTSPAKSPSGSDNAVATSAAPPITYFRPSLFQQAIRALFHMVQFAVAYFIMLLAMYYNGYIIISIIVGAYLGAFVFSWENIKLGSGGNKEATYCCG